MLHYSINRAAAAVTAVLLLAGATVGCAPPRTEQPAPRSESGVRDNAPAAAEIPVWWSTSELGITRLQDIPAEMAKPFEGGITVSNAAKEKALAADCGTARELQAQGYKAQYPRDIAVLGVMTAKCMALTALLTVKPAHTSFLPKRPYSSMLVEMLPAALAPSFSTAQQLAIERATKGGQPIRMVEVTVTFEAALDEEIHIAGEGWQETLMMLARGDFDGDSKLDWLLRADLAMERGTHRNSRLFLMSRSSPDSVISVTRELKPGN